MDSEYEFSPEESSNLIVVERFEEMLSEKKSFFFDVDEFEDLLNYYNSKNNVNRALAVVKHAMQLHPDSATILVSCAQLYVAIHKPQEALRYLNLAETFEPFNIELFYTKASIFSQLRKSDKAIEQYKKALDHAEDFEKEDIQLQLAFEYENLSKYSFAIEHLQEILKTNHENETALYELGFCYDVSEKIEDGKAYFEKFVNLHPYSYIGWFNLGITFGKLKLYEKAIDAYDFAIAIKEDFSSAYFNKAHCFGQQGNHVEALKCFNETLQFDTEDSLSYYYMGESLEKLESYEKAVSFYKKAIELDEFLADAWLGVGSCYFELGRDLDSISYIKKALELDELNPDYYYLLGEVQTQLGFYKEALASFLKVYELDVQNDTILIDIANTCDELNDSEEAMNYFCKGVKDQPNNGKLLYNFVAFLFKKGDLINALFYLDSALKNFYDLKEELFEVYEEAKFNPQVIELLEYYKK